MAAANLLESKRRGFRREGRRLEAEQGGLGLLGSGIAEVGAAAAPAAVAGVLCKQIKEANGCSNLTYVLNEWMVGGLVG